MLEKAIGMRDLLHRKFILYSADGKDFSGKERPVELEFTQAPGEDGFRVSGGICNRFTGQGSLENGLLTVKNLISTKMLCADEGRNELENTFAQMLGQGAVFSLEDGTLVLRQGGHKLVYTAHECRIKRR